MTNHGALIYAIEHKNVVRFSYGGYVRHLQPHILGELPDGKVQFAGWQTASGKAPGQDWRTFDLDKLESEINGDQGCFDRPHDGFDPQFYGFKRIIAQVRL